MPRYDPKTALIVVDVQNDFADSKGSLYVRGGEQVVARVNREIEEALSRGGLVVYTQDWHPESTPHFDTQGGLWPVHCVMGTWGSELHPDLDVRGEVVRKGSGGEDGYSGFTMRHPELGDEKATELGDLLRAEGIERVVVAGLATDYCVKETALDALRLGFDTIVLEDAVAAVNLEPGDDRRALEALKDAGGRVS